MWVFIHSNNISRFRHKICTSTHFHTSVYISPSGQFYTFYLALSHTFPSWWFGIVPRALTCTFLLGPCYTPALEHSHTSLLEQSHKPALEPRHTAPEEHQHTVPLAQGHTFPWEHSHTAGVEHCGNVVLEQIYTAALEQFCTVHAEHIHNVPWAQICMPGVELSLEQICTPVWAHCGTSAGLWFCKTAWGLACMLALARACRFSGQLFGIHALETAVRVYGLG